MKIRLKELRESHKLSQLQLSKDLNVAPSTVSGWEVGYREMDYESMIKVARYFNVSVDYLLGKEIKLDEGISVDNLDIAFLGEIKDLSPEAKDKILDYVKLVKMSEKK